MSAPHVPGRSVANGLTLAETDGRACSSLCVYIAGWGLWRRGERVCVRLDAVVYTDEEIL